MAPLLTPRRVMIARIVAVAVDLAQYALLPAALTPLNNFVDVATAVTLVGLVGWHWAFLPSFAIEVLPFLDIVPTWTLAVLYATRNAPGSPAPRAPGDPGAAPPPPPLLPPAAPPPGTPPPSADQPRGGSGS